MTEDFVYMIGSTGTGMVKLGYSKDPGKRLKELQTGNPYTIEVLATVPGSIELEQVLHVWFADLAYRGEWFCFPQRDQVDQLREALNSFRGMDGCPFEWMELYVNCLAYPLPHPLPLLDRLINKVRPDRTTEDRVRRLTAVRALPRARQELRDQRVRNTA